MQILSSVLLCLTLALGACSYNLYKTIYQDNFVRGETIYQNDFVIGECQENDYLITNRTVYKVNN